MIAEIPRSRFGLRFIRLGSIGGKARIVQFRSSSGVAIRRKIAASGVIFSNFAYGP